MTKEELIKDEDYSEEEAERMILQDKLDKANERIATLEDNIKFAKELITNDLKINKIGLEEDIAGGIKLVMKSWVKYDKKLLEILKVDE